MATVYAWKADSRFPIGAQIAAERLNAIRKQRGEITPHAVLDDARNSNSPLHRCFEWDDSKAAEAHRLDQARKLTASIIVAEYEGTKVDRETRAFVHISAGTQRYEPIQIAMSSTEMREEVIDRARQEIARWRDRYAAYEEFGDLVTRIDEALAAKPPARRRGSARRV